MMSGFRSPLYLDEYMNSLWFFTIHPSWQAHNVIFNEFREEVSHIEKLQLKIEQLETKRSGHS